ncbi:MAG: hypothetical protein M3M87_07585 [Thermoproteota archaeon]|nr:hypothetical protein [Thermoproteota archaeon]
MSRPLSEKDPSIEELKYGETKASKQIIAEHRVDVIIKAGDCIASLKEQIIDLSLVSNVSTSMVILYSLLSISKAYLEERF